MRKMSTFIIIWERKNKTMCDYCEKVACGSCTNSNTSECLHGGKKSDSKSVIKEFGTEPYGNPNGFKLICCKCGKPAIIVPTHFYETQDTTAPDKITLELRCTCGNKYGATIHTKHGGVKMIWSQKREELRIM